MSVGVCVMSVLMLCLGTGYGLSLRATTLNCDAKYQITVNHSACATPNLYGGNSGVSDAEKTEILNYHNNLRKAVTPPATDMLKLTWDDSIANLAQRRASHCVWGHEHDSYQREDYGRFHVGQNIASHTSKHKGTWTSRMDSWAHEVAHFHYGVSTHSTVGHYTQMVWSNTTKIGCGYAECDFGHRYGTANALILPSHYFVCNYGPSGNSGNKFKPYAIGPHKTESERCSSCPHSCVDGLCDCKSKVCFNKGVLNKNTCTCTCLQPPSGNGYLSSNDCALDCDAVTDSHYCGKYYKNCHTSGAKCPHMCNWCKA